MRLLPGIAAALLFSAAAAAVAQNISVCGEALPVSDQGLQLEIEGQAQALSKYLGNAKLVGQLKNSQKEIFSRYPDAARARSNAYFEHVFCEIIMADRTLTTDQKLQRWKEVRREFTVSPPKPQAKKPAGKANVVATAQALEPTPEKAVKTKVTEGGPDKATSVEVPAIAPDKVAKPKVYTVRIVPEPHLSFGLYDGRQLAGKLSPMNSKLMVLVDGDLVLTLWLNDPPFAGLTVRLQEGGHKFQIFGAVTMSLDDAPPYYAVNANCLSDFKVTGDVSFYPVVELRSKNWWSLEIPSCALIKQVVAGPK